MAPHELARLIYETRHGSRAYNLAREGSDEDKKGVIVGPRQWYFGWRPAPEQIDLSPDHVRYEARKFFKLGAANNPTVIEMLWTRDEDHEVHHPAGEILLAHRDELLSKRVGETFGAYALSQLGRIERHRRWLLEPPKAGPERADFGLPERTVIPKDQLGAAEALLEKKKIDEADVSPQFLAILDRERRYQAKRKEWQQYQRWLRERNPTRAALEAKHGYDTKHAMHLVRLITMAIEILERGEVRVFRDDRDELLAVRDGVFAYDALLERVKGQRARMDAAKATSTLRDAPDEDALDVLCDRIVAEVHGC
jgi:predicted nucleotidyltransferase